MKNRDVKMRERFLQREDERLFQKEYKRTLKKKNRSYNPAEKIDVKRYVHMAFVYACETCYEKRLMWVEKGLEENCNPSLKKKSGLPHKPTPFVITCPNCGGFMQHIATPFYLSEFEPAKIGDNLFIIDENHDCGKPVFNWNGR